ncbi:UDP-N-acetylmuramoyl-tripeptide--D-alanyl-D-alanine ligase [Clostridiisalibacter paucivorans]|uniref:UDP-N-acetylmuramoyl-tripeptide--D-alanyl-D- alanine ligase n=1 Tax=Clostridiisalibacter paucivorans TaxID=408753 RepID=UPI00047DEBDC|nr:UDP-N-acetylmuramoyl-tripeptide--D-alanyl-D-alanine ligase [Clostridiisalibacter paucivorans]
MDIILNNLGIIGAILFVIWLIPMYWTSRYTLHMMQLEGYRNNQYKRWLKESGKNVFSNKVRNSAIALFLLEIIVILIDSKILLLPMILLFLLFCFLLVEDFKSKNAKKDLVFTKRAKRLFIAIIAINLIIMLIYGLVVINFSDRPFDLILIGSLLIIYGIPQTIILANLLVLPIEKRINKYYYDMAYNKVRNFENMNIVGITGSFGKTSTKFITAEILRHKYNVLNTPESYNTPMGISKVINNTLDDSYEAFVVEMGARNIGDIDELAKLVGPKIGVLTSIGPTHLETFKNIENIMKTKYELIENLPADGIAIFNYDNKYVRKLADKTFKEKILYGIKDHEYLDIYAKDIEVNEGGSTFILSDKEGNSVKCSSKLLGKHNISNILAGVAVANAMGMNLDDISKGISKVEPIPHRLQLINPGTGVIIIDDAFNSNPVGAKAALEVLNQFKEGRKVIVTPGMVELGDREEEENKEFGKNISKVCDFVILVGEKRTRPIYQGLVEQKFNKDNIFVVKTLDESTGVIQSLVKEKDVVLFENDLPDNYNE